jgi:hypothetical protein
MISVKGILNDGFETFGRWKYRGRNDNLSAPHLIGLEFYIFEHHCMDVTQSKPSHLWGVSSWRMFLSEKG